LLQRTLNLGILAHVDAGKTTLTERLLYAAGVIDELGSVDDGTTQTDTLALERQRGITIKSAVVSFAIADTDVNLIDTPGHPDFIAEVERVLGVLDGAVLVVSAVEGVQAQTRVLMRALQRRRIPTLIFVNKIDRRGARSQQTVDDIADKLGLLTVSLGSVDGEGTPNAVFTAVAGDDPRLIDVLSANDAALLTAFLADEASVSPELLRGRLVSQTAATLVHPVYFGSAITGAGLPELMAGIAELLPTSAGDVDGPVSGSVFKIERGAGGERIAYVRLFSGTIRVRDRLQFHSEGRAEQEPAKVTGLNVFENGSSVERPAAGAGRICKLRGLGEIRIGDVVGSAPSPRRAFAPPTLESVVVPVRRDDKHALHVALTQLAEQDPLINLRQDDVQDQLYVSLYGEVQKEVIQATLVAEFDVDVEFEETTPIYIERPTGTGSAVEILGSGGNPFLATVGCRIEPAPAETFAHALDVRSIPLYVFTTVEEFGASIETTVLATLEQGLYGWQVTNWKVTMTDCGYASPVTTAADFRKLIPLVLMSALQEAGTEVCEPIHEFRLEGPADALQSAFRVLAQLRADPRASSVSSSSFTIEGEIAAARMHLLQRQLRSLTHGEGLLEFEFVRYQPLDGVAPTRARLDHNPLNRKKYLLHVTRPGRVPFS
jgi:ribosomal protection tetracycline resistance protein